MRILVIGANGFLGKKAVKIFRENHEVIETSSSDKNMIRMNLTNKEEIMGVLDKYKPDVIFNSGAITDLDFCEKEKSIAWEINVSGPIFLAEICKKRNIKFVAISSDYVFSGDNSPYYENSVTNPKSFYGSTKKIMEEGVSQVNPDSIIIRPSILYGFNSINDKDKIVIPLFKFLKNNQEIFIEDIRPKYPVLIDDFVKNVLLLIEKGCRGLFNFASESPINRYEMAKIVAKVFELNEEIVKKADLISDFKNKPYDVQLINVRAPFLKFVSFEEGVKIIKKQMENKNEDN